MSHITPPHSQIVVRQGRRKWSDEEHGAKTHEEEEKMYDRPRVLMMGEVLDGDAALARRQKKERGGAA